MEKITFMKFESIMSIDLLANMPEDFDISKLEPYEIGPCIEIAFCVDGDETYHESWMGKLINKETRQYVYWYGLVEDGTQAYDYDSFGEFANDKVFHRNKSLKEIWDSISLVAINCHVGKQGQLQCYCADPSCEGCFAWQDSAHIGDT